MKRVIPAILCLLLISCADLYSAKLAYQNNDVESARTQWQTLADKGFPEAYAQLSKLYLEGKAEQDIDIEKAIFYYNLAHQSGYTKNFKQLAHFISIHDTPNDFKRTLITHLEHYVSQGNQDALLLQSQLKLEGIYYEKDTIQALDSVNKLVQKGHAEASYYLASIFRIGLHLEQDLEEAYRLNKKAFYSGYIKAGEQLVHDLEYGIGVEQNIKEAERILRRLASNNQASAKFKLASFLQRNSKVVSQEIIELYQSAQNEGYVLAKLRMADLYLHGESIQKSPDKAIKMYSELSLSGLGNASAKLGDLFRDGEYLSLDYEKANDYYELALEQGFENAQLRIANMYLQGLGVKRDIELAKSIYYRFASKGLASAAFNYASIIEQQDTNSKLSKEAYNWYFISANSGFVKGKIRLIKGVLYGAISAQSQEEAIATLQHLAEKHHPDAQMLLANVYRTNRWNKYNITESERYFLMALKQGRQQAIFKLYELYSDPNSELYDFHKAQSILKQLDLSGRVDESFKLARQLEGYIGKNSIPPELLFWYQQTANKGYVPARLRLADLMLEGIGIDRNIEIAIAEYSLLSSLGVGAATSRMAKLYERGKFFPKDSEKARILYQQAIEQGYLGAYLPWARLIYLEHKTSEDIDIAYQILMKQALQGKPEAQFYLASMYHELKEKLTNDWLEQALYWYQLSSFEGYQDAKYEYALLLEERAGEVVIESTQLINELAMIGHGRAQLLYSTRLFNGKGVSVNKTEGLMFSYLAAVNQTKGALDVLLKQTMLIEELEQVDVAIEQANSIKRPQIATLTINQLLGVKSHEQKN
ncbi:tetratricopeptide repeat protein [Pseudoalteromonas sp.]|uniref:tetratricopeptide repeat protein n=1 Tax=Pseudoalteromonas sp. TaxID=53249 RepID=UPI00356ACDBC